MQSATQKQTAATTAPDDGSETQDRQNDPDGRAYMAALRQFTSGNLREAKALVQLLLVRDSRDAKALHLMGLIQFELGDLEAAAARLRESIEVGPSSVEALSDLAAILRELGKLEEALQASLTAISLNAKYYPAYAILGRIYKSLGKQEESAACYLQAVEIAPDHARGYSDLGLAYLALGKSDEAVKACRRAAELSPEDTDIIHALGKALRETGRLEDAIALYENADARLKGQLPVLCALAACYSDGGQYEKALATHRRSIELAPDSADANIALGDTFRKMGRIPEALNCYQHAVSLAPDDAAAIASEAAARFDLGQLDTAIEGSKEAISLDASSPLPYKTISRALTRMGRFGEALAVQARAVSLDRLDAENLADYFLLARQVGDWEGIGEAENALRDASRRKVSGFSPSALLDLECTAEEMLLGARSWAGRFSCDNPILSTASKPRSRAGEPIHLAYIYERVADARLMEFLSRVIANHDRDRFRVTGFCVAREKGLARHALPENAFDATCELGHLCFAEAAAKIYEAGVDVLVTVEGYRSRAVPAILAHRPAPVQVNYPGYPATMGTEFIDYIIGDSFTMALDQQPFFDEKIVQLPDCLVAVPAPDAQSQPAAVPDRESQRLPEAGIVFCCFNPVATISPDCFAVWMNILKNVPGSVLWLLDDNDAATKNLKRNAAALGIDPARLVFAGRCGRTEHFARLPLADLYFDTMPSTVPLAVAEALAAGVPVLTCAGETLVSRLSGSLLTACKLSDMITYAHDHYDHVARLLTCDPKSLKRLRERLAENLKTTRLFDSASFQCGLDAAFEHMVAIARNGEFPYAFAVALGQDDRKAKENEIVQPPPEEELLLLAEADAC